MSLIPITSWYLSCQKWSLSTETGMNSEHWHMWPPNNQANRRNKKARAELYWRLAASAVRTGILRSDKIHSTWKRWQYTGVEMTWQRNQYVQRTYIQHDHKNEEELKYTKVLLTDLKKVFNSKNITVRNLTSYSEEQISLIEDPWETVGFKWKVEGDKLKKYYKLKKYLYFSPYQAKCILFFRTQETVSGIKYTLRHKM